MVRSSHTENLESYSESSLVERQLFSSLKPGETEWLPGHSMEAEKGHLRRCAELLISFTYT